MNAPSEFAMGDIGKDYCAHCARPDGSMQSFEEKRASMADFIVRTQGIDRAVALGVAEAMMRNLPAWKDKYKQI
jgi:hypothetical protein